MTLERKFVKAIKTNKKIKPKEYENSDIDFLRGCLEINSLTDIFPRLLNSKSISCYYVKKHKEYGLVLLDGYFLLDEFKNLIRNEDVTSILF